MDPPMIAFIYRIHVGSSAQQGRLAAKIYRDSVVARVARFSGM
jgi:hypothetical protein